MQFRIQGLETVGPQPGAAVGVALGWYPPVLRKAAVAIAGFVVLIVGVAFIFLPAPSVVVIPLGLAILAREFPWAQKVLDWSRGRVRRSWIVVRDRLAKVA
jgi:uncharacterized protein (TIGR02611 family)